jgi:RNA polymerase sigma factor (sigma-70 family)
MEGGRRDGRPLGLIAPRGGSRVVERLSDGQLLRRFLARRDAAGEEAFATLVARHGPMVERVCRGILRDAHDAQDAHQATFLVLALRARSIRRRESVASWLFGVARRVSAKAKGEAFRRRAFERRCAELVPRPVATAAPPELCPELFEELDRLPEPFRVPILLIDLEGCTQEEAAVRLGWPLGTVQSRLARGRARLRARLLRRGLAPTAAGVLVASTASQGASATSIDPVVRAATSALAAKAATGAVPPRVAALAKGALKTMFSIKWPMATAAGVVSLLGAGLFVIHAPASRPPRAGASAPDLQGSHKAIVQFAHQVLARHFGADDTADKDKADKDKADKAKADKASAEKADKEMLRGKWKVVSGESDGVEQADAKDIRIAFDPDAGTFTLNHGEDFKMEGKFTIDASAEPKSIDLEFVDGPHAGDKLLGIYAKDGKKLKWCTTLPKGTDRPKEFTTKVASGHRLYVLEHVEE